MSYSGKGGRVYVSHVFTILILLKDIVPPMYSYIVIVNVYSLEGEKCCTCTVQMYSVSTISQYPYIITYFRLNVKSKS